MIGVVHVFIQSKENYKAFFLSYNILPLLIIVKAP